MGKQIRYSDSFKMETIKSYFQGELSANQLAKKLGIHPHTVQKWIRDYKNNEARGNESDITMIVSKIYRLESDLGELKMMIEAKLQK